MPTTSAHTKIQALQQQIDQLKQEAIQELKQKLHDARQVVANLEKELAELSGSIIIGPTVRTRRVSVSDDDLKSKILEVLARNGMHGKNAKEIAEAIGHSPIRVRDFIKTNPRVLRRQGAGPGTKFFLP